MPLKNVRKRLVRRATGKIQSALTPKSQRLESVFAVFAAGQIFKGLELELAVFVFDQQLDFLLGFVELLIAELDQTDPFFERGEGIFQRKLAGFQPLHNLFQVFQSRLEFLTAIVFARHTISPFWFWFRDCSPIRLRPSTATGGDRCAHWRAVRPSEDARRLPGR